MVLKGGVIGHGGGRTTSEDSHCWMFLYNEVENSVKSIVNLDLLTCRYLDDRCSSHYCIQISIFNGVVLCLTRMKGQGIPEIALVLLLILFFKLRNLKVYHF